MTVWKFFRSCLPVSLTFSSFSLFNLVEVMLISSLGTGAIVLVGSAAVAVSVFGAFMDGLRLVLVQDVSRAGNSKSYIGMVAGVCLTCVLLFTALFLVWFPSVVGDHGQQYNLFLYGILTGVQMLFFAARYVVQGLLYAEEKEDWVTYLFVGGSVFQTALTGLFVWTDLLPAPKYLAPVISATIAFLLQSLIGFVLLGTVPPRQSAASPGSATRGFLQRVLPVAADRVGVFVGFFLVFSVISRFSTEAMAGYVFISRAIGPVFLTAYGAELVLTRAISHTEAVSKQLRLVGVAMVSALMLGGAVILLEFVLKQPLIRLAFPNSTGAEIARYSAALVVACGMQIFNFAQILLSGFLRAIGLRWTVLAVNVAVFAMVLPLGLQLWPSLGDSLMRLWLFIGLGYAVAFLLFGAKAVSLVIHARAVTATARAVREGAP